jgi:hypothetical protein
MAESITYRAHTEDMLLAESRAERQERHSNTLSIRKVPAWLDTEA